jgi:orotidine-5'-phosphate decarboxylase
MILAVLPGRTAEDAVRAASALAGAAGFVVAGDLLAGPGPAVISALRASGDVLVLAGLHGDPGQAAAAADRLRGYGATWVTVQAADGPGLVEAVAGTGVGVVARTLGHGQDDSTAARIGGRSRGKAVSRLAELAVGAGADGVLCDVPDLGVVAQVAPEASRFAWAETPAEAVDASGRGADYLLVGAASFERVAAALADG